jgi:hypothetical protein
MVERKQDSVLLALITLVLIIAVLLPAYGVARQLIIQNPTVKIGQVTILLPRISGPEWRSVDIRQLQCLADNIYYEAKGEPDLGKIAVARVVMNRVEAGFEKDPCAVIYQGAPGGKIKAADSRGGCQFSWLCGGRTLAIPNPEIPAPINAIFFIVASKKSIVKLERSVNKKMNKASNF